MKKNIALLAGGYSGEYEISVQSAATIARHLDYSRYHVYTIFITKTEWYYKEEKGEKVIVNKDDFSLFVNGERMHFDAVFFAIHGTPGEDGKLQGYFDLLQIPYTGCGVITSALTFNKGYCNKVVAGFKEVKVARSLHYFYNQPYNPVDILTQLKLPVFVKPAEGGSSIGISKVSKEEELTDAIKLAFDTDHQILIEEYIEGRELSCGIFNTSEGITALPITEIKSTKDFFNYEAKYTHGMADEITPASIGDEITQEVQEAAKALYWHLNCNGIVRFDFILEKTSNELYFLEVNTMPGQSPGSIVPRQIKAAGLEPEDVYNALIEKCFTVLS